MSDNFQKTNEIFIPDFLRESCSGDTNGERWLALLPKRVEELRVRWSLDIEDPLEKDASCSWVAPCRTSDGAQVVLKLGFPHMEAHEEIQGLLFWNGNPCVTLLEFDRDYNALLLERCIPGDALNLLPEEKQDVILAELLKRLWRMPANPHKFRLLSVMLEYWIEECLESDNRGRDLLLVNRGVEVLRELLDSTEDMVLLATDLHAGNVLKAEREPWLVIDPKPFIGDRAYDATQHLLNCMGRLGSDPINTVEKYSALLDLNKDRVRRWLFARLAINHGKIDSEKYAIAKALQE